MGDSEEDLRFEALYKELRQLARVQLLNERPGHTLQATALVHEVFLRLPESERLDPVRFQHAAARAMRRILIDHARSKKRLKRQAGSRIPLDAVSLTATGNLAEVIAVDEAMEQLAVHDAALAELARLRFYAGMSVEEIAKLRGCSSRKVVRDWAYASGWLRRAIGEEDA